MFDMYHTVLCTDISSLKEDLACKISGSHSSFAASWVLQDINPLELKLHIYSLAHHLCKMWIFYEPRRVTLGNKRHFVEE